MQPAATTRPTSKICAVSFVQYIYFFDILPQAPILNRRTAQMTDDPNRLKRSKHEPSTDTMFAYIYSGAAMIRKADDHTSKTLHP